MSQINEQRDTSLVLCNGMNVEGAKVRLMMITKIISHYNHNILLHYFFTSNIYHFIK